MSDHETCQSCGGSECSPGAPEAAPGGKDSALSSRMSRIHHKVVVLSGKGGVGKSTVAANLAVALALAGKRVGLLDVDLHGPSVPKLLCIEGTPVTGRPGALLPVDVAVGNGALCAMSIGLLLRERDDAVIWRGPMKHGAIKQLLKDVEWGDLDFLVIDAPPGTGDEPLAVAQLLDGADGAVVVTTPQELAVQDVRRCIVFCRQVGLPVLGVIENMNGLVCPRCGESLAIFGAGGGRAMAEEMGVPYLGAIPIDPEVAASGDSGKPVVSSRPDSEAARAFGILAHTLLEGGPAPTEERASGTGDGPPLRIAVPVAEGTLAPHFGHCHRFALFDVEPDGRTVGRFRYVEPPPHEPGAFPKWLHEQGATVIIAGGMGSRAQELFGQNGIRVVVGASGGAPEAIVRDFLDGRLETGANVCDH
jgi:ATP-binding protein involved in chromosome partitioning